MNSGPTLRNRSTGDDVRRLQRLFVMMKTLGPTEIDGAFGPRTEAAVRDFQSGHRLTADGVVGDRTWWAPAGGAGATLASLAGLTTV